MPLAGQKVTYISHDKTTANVEFRAPKQPVTCKSVFDGRSVVSKFRKDFVKGAWTKIRSKLVHLNADRASSLKDEI
ncbi:hypothetical protein KY284_030253 [Solanum tuberosum]|nr:hypothetical protein KY284_030253 [Solanum tuberosum]